jgi:hypothetical protein
LARKTRITSATSKRGTSGRKKAAIKTPNEARARGRRMSEGTESSDERGTTSTTATRKQQPQTSNQRSIRSVTAEPDVGLEHRRASQSQQGASRSAKLKSLLGSSVVRKVVAAGLASAAATILYRKPRSVATEDQGGSGAPTELMPGEASAESTTYTAPRRVGRRTVAAESGVAARTASAGTKARRRGKASDAVDEPTSGVAEQPTRKRRSDAGLKRPPRRTRAEVGAPSGIEPVAVDVPASLNTTETSVFASDTGVSGATDTSTSAADEQLAEAHPS